MIGGMGVLIIFSPTVLGPTSHIIIQNPPLTPHGGTRGKFGVSIGLTSNMVSHVLNQKHRHNDYQNRKDVIKKYIAFDEIDQGEPTKD